MCMVKAHVMINFLLGIWQLYQAESGNNWKAKDAAIFLVTSLASKKQTAKVLIMYTSRVFIRHFILKYAVFFG